MVREKQTTRDKESNPKTLGCEEILKTITPLHSKASCDDSAGN